MFSWLKFVNTKKNIASGNLKLPHLFISGGDDALSDYGKHIVALVELMKKLGYEDIEYKIYPKARHEVLNELNKDEVYQDVLNFFKK
jgi:alpha-beta hydrolase superfamily lysophospholipase